MMPIFVRSARLALTLEMKSRAADVMREYLLFERIDSE